MQALLEEEEERWRGDGGRMRATLAGIKQTPLALIGAAGLLAACTFAFVQAGGLALVSAKLGAAYELGLRGWAVAAGARCIGRNSSGQPLVAGPAPLHGPSDRADLHAAHHAAHHASRSACASLGVLEGTKAGRVSAPCLPVCVFVCRAPFQGAPPRGAPGRGGPH
jgi:hypothetical protein